MSTIPVCRVCLKTSLEYIDFETSFVQDDADNDTKSEVFTYLDCFRICTGLQIEEFSHNNNNSLPQSLCDTCGFELRVTYDFLQKAKNSHKIIQGKMIESKMKIVENEMEYEETQFTQKVDCKNEINYDNDDLKEEQENISKQKRCLHTPPATEEFELVTVENSFYTLSSGNALETMINEIDENEADDSVKYGVLKTAAPASWLRVGSIPRASKDRSFKTATPTHRRQGSPLQKKEENVKKSIKLATELDTNQFQCELCNKCFANKDRLKRHITRERNSKIWLCHACPRIYRDARAYNEHVLKHEGKCERNFTCEQCGRKFFRRSTLNDHIKIHEINREPTFQCDKCDKSFFHRGSLTLHKQSHTGQWIECDICEKRYLRQSDLIIHLRSHSGDLPYKCHKCDRAFAQMGHLNKHLLHHDGYRYKCDVCDKEYMHHSTLIEHYKGHTGLPFKCSICDKGFVKMSKVHRHLEAVHKVQNIEEKEQFIVKIKRKKVICGKKA